MIDRLISLVVALGLALLVWLYACSREQENLDNVPVPVHISLTPGQADHYDLEVTGPGQVTVSFTGSPSRIRELRGMLQRGQVRVKVVLAVPEERQNEPRYLDTVLVTSGDLHVPPGVTSVVVEGRNRIPVTLRRIVERRIPVHLDQPPDQRFGKVTLDPPSVLVRGPQEVLDRLRTISTQPFTLPGLDEPDPDRETRERTLGGLVALVKEFDGRSLQATPEMVTVRVALKPRQRVYTLTEVPIHFLCPSGFGLRPRFGNDRFGKITLQVQGPACEEPPAVTAFIDLTRRKFYAGLYGEEPVQIQLPKEYQLAQPAPRSAGFELQPIPSTPVREAGLGPAHGL